MYRIRPLALAFATGLFLATPLAAQQVPTPQGLSLSELREIRSTYIIELAPSVSPDELEGRARGLAARFNGRVKHVYGTVYNGFAIRMSDQAIARLLQADDTGVIRVTRDDVVSIDARPPWAGGGGSSGGGGNCGQELGWNIERITDNMDGNACSSENYNKSTRGTVTYGKPGVWACVIDTGVDYNHEDLNVDTTLAMTFAGGRDASDKNGHGTHVAGIIGAEDNAIGVVGVAPGVPITPIKVLGNGGSGSYANVIAGVDYAAEIGCPVANMSLGGPPYDPLDTAVQCAAGNGGSCADNHVLFSLAAGNETDNASNHSPARANGTGIYTIAAFGEGDAWSSYSNYGIPPVDYALPGTLIKSTVPGGYATYSGTSMAAPHMAGLLIRMLSDEFGDGSFAIGGQIDGPDESYAVPASDLLPPSPVTN